MGGLQVSRGVFVQMAGAIEFERSITQIQPNSPGARRIRSGPRRNGDAGEYLRLQGARFPPPECPKRSCDPTSRRKDQEAPRERLSSEFRRRQDERAKAAVLAFSILAATIARVRHVPVVGKQRDLVALSNREQRFGPEAVREVK